MKTPPIVIVVAALALAGCSSQERAYLSIAGDALLRALAVSSALTDSDKLRHAEEFIKEDVRPAIADTLDDVDAVRATD